MNKYHNIHTTIDGIRFDSKKEARRYADLILLQKAGAIRQLELQPRFPIVVNGVKVCTYVADFAYFENARVVEDVKGVRTAVYKLKAKMLLACYPGIDFREIF